ncbi:hypothetical protein ACFYOA_04615 [Streptomyces iakyrus]|uniref:hypothetical protein n=1 Tax=Streptomyces iakyrus TaxID=68219 RepID=UPI00368B08B0
MSPAGACAATPSFTLGSAGAGAHDRRPRCRRGRPEAKTGAPAGTPWIRRAGDGRSRHDPARRARPPAVPAVLLGAPATLLAGTLTGLAADPAHLVGTIGYVVATGLLLAVGPYGSTYGIDLADLRRDLRGVVAAVMLGVVLKAGLARAVTSAFLLATVLLGLFVAQGVSLGPGLPLGASAFLARAVVAMLLMPLFVRGLSGRDRVLLGIGQQNGLTSAAASPPAWPCPRAPTTCCATADTS